MIRRYFFFLFIFIIAAGFTRLGAIEFKQGLIYLQIHEKTGSYSLFYLTDPSTQQYEAFFHHKDPTTSFFAVNINNRVFRPGESRSFNIKTDIVNDNPFIIFESSFLLITKEFSFIKTAGSNIENGIKIAITVTNKSMQQVSAGLRVLIDTSLGEGRGMIPFSTERENITSETIIRSNSGERFWITPGPKFSLMGSIVNPRSDSAKTPDYLHFANWKRLNDVLWNVPYSQGRSFHYPPYSIGDSAVCYYYENDDLSPGGSFDYSIYLAAEDRAGFLSPLSVTELITENNRESDMQTLRELLNTLDKFISGEINLSDRQLAEINMSVSILKERYGL